MKRVAIGLAVALGLAAPARPARAWTFDWAGHVEVDAEGLQSDDPNKRIQAVIDLAKYDIALTEAHLIKALGDADEKVRHQAAKALGQGGSAAAVPMMIDWLGDTSAQTKAVAAEALGEIGGADATAALVRSLGDP